MLPAPCPRTRRSPTALRSPSSATPTEPRARSGRRARPRRSRGRAAGSPRPRRSPGAQPRSARARQRRPRRRAGRAARGRVRPRSSGAHASERSSTSAAVRVDGSEGGGGVAEQLGVHAAGADDDDRPEARIPARADEQLEAGGGVLGRLDRVRAARQPLERGGQRRPSLGEARARRRRHRTCAAPRAPSARRDSPSSAAAASAPSRVVDRRAPHRTARRLLRAPPAPPQ